MLLLAIGQVVLEQALFGKLRERLLVDGNRGGPVFYVNRNARPLVPSGDGVARETAVRGRAFETLGVNVERCDPVFLVGEAASPAIVGDFVESGLPFGFRRDETFFSAAME